METTVNSMPPCATLSHILHTKECTGEQWKGLGVRAYFLWLAIVISFNGLLFGVAIAFSRDTNEYLAWTAMVATLFSITLYWSVIGYGLHNRDTSIMRRRGTLHSSVVAVLLTSLSIGMYMETRFQTKCKDLDARWIIGLIPPFLLFLLLAVLVARQRMIYHVFRAFRSATQNLYRNTLLLQLVLSSPVWAGQIAIVVIMHDQALAMLCDALPMVLSFVFLVYYTYKCSSVPPSFSDYQSNGRVLFTALLLYSFSVTTQHLLPESATYKYYFMDWCLVCIGEVYILDSFLPVMFLLYFDITPVDLTVTRKISGLTVRTINLRIQVPPQAKLKSPATKKLADTPLTAIVISSEESSLCQPHGAEV